MRFLILISVLLLAGMRCTDFLEIDPPRTDLVRQTVFESDQTASAAVADLYYQVGLINSFASGGPSSISYYGAISSDEAVDALNIPATSQFYENSLLPDNSRLLSLWSQLYKTIYQANAILEGVNGQSKLSPVLKIQLEGQARFFRAFCHFYLVNLFGDVPLVINTDYLANQRIGRTSANEVYRQIVEDLKMAQQFLSEDYSYSNAERIQINKWAASALLARTYLYTEDWTNANVQASALIDNTALYGLTTLEEVFLKNSKETIFQLAPLTGSVYDRATAVAYTTLQPALVASFEHGDQRFTQWVTNGNVGNKYRSDDNSYSEYSTVLRLAEQYLVRAEARAHLGDIAGAIEDINVVRSRAGLPSTSADDQLSCLSAIDHERRVELFLEWGHRWLDLKRTNRMNEVLPPVKPYWKETARLFPIPEAQIMNDPEMRYSQNEGY